MEIWCCKEECKAQRSSAAQENLCLLHEDCSYTGLYSSWLGKLWVVSCYVDNERLKGILCDVKKQKQNKKKHQLTSR